MKHIATLGLLSMAFAVTSWGAGEPVAKITVVEGNASVLRAGGDKWINARPNMTLSVGDEIYARVESFVEVRYTMGAVLRLDENSKIQIKAATAETTQTRTALGSVWVNMKKITKSGTTFDVASPTAVASIRGTIYQMTTGADSSTDVSVYDGKVAVSLTDSLKKAVAPPPPPPGERTEVSGPEEIPGPFEVSLDQWKTIVAGQRISVRKDGTFSQDKFDMKSAAKNRFVKKNREMDAALMKE